MKSSFNLRPLKIASLISLEFTRRHAPYFLAGVLIIAALMFTQFKFNLFYSKNSVRIGLVGTFQEHDLPEEVTKLVSDSLVVPDKNNRIKPNLAAGWETNNNATVFKFKLKDNLKWQDGSKIISSDLEFPIPDVEVSYPDEKSVQFKLSDSYSPFPSLLNKPLFKKGTLLGTGSYKIDKIEKSRIFITKITLIPIDLKLPIIYVRFYPNEKVAQTGFALGEVEAILGINKSSIYANDPNIVLKQNTDYTKIVTVLYSMIDPFVGGKNRSLRQALSYIVSEVKGEEVADSPYPPFSWGYDKTAKKYLNNQDEAKAALERAKTQISEDKLHAEIILTATPNLEEVGKEIVLAWKSLGFDAKLRIESGIPQNFQSLLITQSIPTDPDQYFLWHATQTKTNLSGLDSPRVDKDLEDGRKIISEDDRKLKYFDFQKALLEEAPAIFLYFPKYNIVYLKKSEPLLDKILSL